MMNQRKVDTIDKNYVNFLIFNECNNIHRGAPADIDSLQYLIMLGGSPEVLMFALAFNKDNMLKDYTINGLRFVSEFEKCIAYSKHNIEKRFGRSAYPNERIIHVNLERFSPENLTNVTLTQEVYDIFHFNGHNLNPMCIGMSILDFTLHMLEDTKVWVKASCGEDDENGNGYIEEYEFAIDMLLKYGAKPTPKLLLHMLKEGKDCSIIQEHLEKIA